VLLIALPLFSTQASGLLLMLLDIPLRVFYYLLSFFAKAGRGFIIYTGSPPLLLVVSVLIAFYLLAVSRSKFHKFIFGFFILAGIGYMTITIFYYAPRNLEVFYLDVGQGDAEVVVFPGGDALLIDAGGAYYSSDAQVGLKTVLPFLLEKKIKIKWAAISHFHPDHARGISEIVPIIRPEELWISSEPGDDPAYDLLTHRLPGSVLIKKLHAPFEKKVGLDGRYRIEILAPDRVIDGGAPRNNHSQVLKVSGPDHSFLFTGDIEAEVETRLAESDASKLGVDVLKVPHHGSRTSSGRDFLKCVKPEWAVFSYAQGNRFHFPHPETGRNYKSQGIKCISTARCGGIRIISMPRRLNIEVSK
ncbi:MAG TPA: MBL fold metallo-hydrolase, partial [Candidatus Deferrimicrobium sp.]|nr:MBL fold metallo-hydrolase [Candidatus Deferrimicrobium sp.]